MTCLLLIKPVWALFGLNFCLSLASQTFSIRIGIHSGSVIAAIIGRNKFIYDLWGDTVNTASLMESHGIPAHIQLTEATYELLQDKYLFEKRGLIQVKGKGEMLTYLLMGRK
jgi:class 3 adenylate cyclase